MRVHESLRPNKCKSERVVEILGSLQPAFSFDVHPFGRNEKIRMRPFLPFPTSSIRSREKRTASSLLRFHVSATFDLVWPELKGVTPRGFRGFLQPRSQGPLSYSRE